MKGRMFSLAGTVETRKCTRLLRIIVVACPWTKIASGMSFYDTLELQKTHTLNVQRANILPVLFE